MSSVKIVTDAPNILSIVVSSRPRGGTTVVADETTMGVVVVVDLGTIRIDRDKREILAMELSLVTSILILKFLFWLDYRRFAALTNFSTFFVKNLT